MWGGVSRPQTALGYRHCPLRQCCPGTSLRVQTPTHAHSRAHVLTCTFTHVHMPFAAPSPVCVHTCTFEHVFTRVLLDVHGQMQFARGHTCSHPETLPHQLLQKARDLTTAQCALLERRTSGAFHSRRHSAPARARPSPLTLSLRPPLVGLVGPFYPEFLGIPGGGGPGAWLVQGEVAMGPEEDRWKRSWSEVCPWVGAHPNPTSQVDKTGVTLNPRGCACAGTVQQAA